MHPLSGYAILAQSPFFTGFYDAPAHRASWPDAYGATSNAYSSADFRQTQQALLRDSGLTPEQMNALQQGGAAFSDVLQSFQTPQQQQLLVQQGPASFDEMPSDWGTSALSIGGATLIGVFLGRILSSIFGS